MRLTQLTLWQLARGGCREAKQALDYWRALDETTTLPTMVAAYCTPEGYDVVQIDYRFQPKQLTL